MKTLLFLSALLLSFNAFGDTVYDRAKGTYVGSCYLDGTHSGAMVIVTANRKIGKIRSGTMTLNGNKVTTQYFSDANVKRWATAQQVFILTGKRDGNLYNINKMEKSILKVRCTEV